MKIQAVVLILIGAAFLILGALRMRKPAKVKQKRSIYDKPTPKINYKRRNIGILVGFALIAIGIVVSYSMWR